MKLLREDGRHHCSFCGQAVAESSEVCIGCGKMFDAGPAPEPADPPATETSGPGYCTNCGTSLVAGAKFCGDCGAPVQRGTPRTRSAAPSFHSLSTASVGVDTREQRKGQKYMTQGAVLGAVCLVMAFLGHELFQSSRIAMANSLTVSDQLRTRFRLGAFMRTAGVTGTVGGGLLVLLGLTKRRA